MKILLGGIVKDFKNSTNFDFEVDRHDDIRDVVTTLVHNQARAATPMDVEPNSLAVCGGDLAASHDHTVVEDYTAAAAHDIEEYDDDLHVHYVGKGNVAGWQTRGCKSKGK